MVGRVGGYGIFFWDDRDAATYILLSEEQTNMRGELRASLRALEGHRLGEYMLVCPGCLLIVNGMLGWAQKWRRHGWATAKGPVQHKDLWEQLLCLIESLGTHVKWLHTPSHIEIPGNSRADHLADVGRRQSPLLYGQISIHPRRQEAPQADMSDEEWEAGCEGWEPQEEPEDPCPPPKPCEEPLQGTPQRQVQGERGWEPEPPPPSPLWDIEVCTPVRVPKRQRMQTPLRFTLQPFQRLARELATPATPATTATPYFVGTRNIFRTPPPPPGARCQWPLTSPCGY